MGMSSDNAENVEEYKPIKKVVEENIFHYTIIGGIILKDGFYQLASGDDKKLYKAKQIGEYRIDEKNRSPLNAIFGDFTPITEADFN